MEYRPLGNSGLSVSALSLGSWMTWESMTEDDARAVIQAGLSAGINFLDDARYDDRTGTAPIKSGYSEVLFGRLLRQIGCARTDLIIANKLWFEFFPGESVEQELDGSLARLGMDYLDIVYCAEVPESLPLVDLIRDLDRLIASGKLHAWGVLNWPADRLATAVGVAAAHGLRGPAAAQLAYSAISRSPVEDADMTRLCRDAIIGVVASYSLQGGLLSGKYGRGVTHGRLSAHLSDPALQPLLPKVDAFLGIADRVGCTPSQLALAYCLKNPQVSSVVFGARHVSQLEENVRALDVVPRLSDEVMTLLHAV